MSEEHAALARIEQMLDDGFVADAEVLQIDRFCRELLRQMRELLDRTARAEADALRWGRAMNATAARLEALQARHLVLQQELLLAADRDLARALAEAPPASTRPS
jgi:hypothetical protein